MFENYYNFNLDEQVPLLGLRNPELCFYPRCCTIRTKRLQQMDFGKMLKLVFSKLYHSFEYINVDMCMFDLSNIGPSVNLERFFDMHSFLQYVLHSFENVKNVSPFTSHALMFSSCDKGLKSSSMRLVSTCAQITHKNNILKERLFIYNIMNFKKSCQIFFGIGSSIWFIFERDINISSFSMNVVFKIMFDDK